MALATDVSNTQNLSILWEAAVSKAVGNTNSPSPLLTLKRYADMIYGETLVIAPF